MAEIIQQDRLYPSSVIAPPPEDAVTSLTRPLGPLCPVEPSCPPISCSKHFLIQGPCMLHLGYTCSQVTPLLPTSVTQWEGFSYVESNSKPTLCQTMKFMPLTHKRRQEVAGIGLAWQFEAIVRNLALSVFLFCQ